MGFWHRFLCKVIRLQKPGRIAQEAKGGGEEKKRSIFLLCKVIRLRKPGRIAQGSWNNIIIMIIISRDSGDGRKDRSAFSSCAKLYVSNSRVGLHRGLTVGLGAAWGKGAYSDGKVLLLFFSLSWHAIDYDVKYTLRHWSLSHLMRSVAGSKQGKST